MEDVHRLKAENEKLASSVQQWTEKVREYVVQKTLATAEMYKRDQTVALVRVWLPLNGVCRLIIMCGDRLFVGTATTQDRGTEGAGASATRGRGELCDRKDKDSHQSSGRSATAPPPPPPPPSPPAPLCVCMVTRTHDAAGFICEQNDEQAMDQMAEEYSRLCAESEARFEADAKLIAVLQCDRSRTPRRTQ